MDKEIKNKYDTGNISPALFSKFLFISIAIMGGFWYEGISEATSNAIELSYTDDGLEIKENVKNVIVENHKSSKYHNEFNRLEIEFESGKDISFLDMDLNYIPEETGWGESLEPDNITEDQAHALALLYDYIANKQQTFETETDMQVFREGYEELLGDNGIGLED